MSDDATDLDVDLLTADDLAEILQKPKTSVYSLPINQVRIGKRTVRWARRDVEDFLNDRYQGDDPLVS